MGNYILSNKRQIITSIVAVAASLFLVFFVVYGATTINTNSVGIGTSTPGGALGVNGAGVFNGFVSANHFTSTSTVDSWLFGNLGLGTTTPGARLAVHGDVIANGLVSANQFTSTSTVSSWLMGKLGIGTTTPSSTLNDDGALAVEGMAIIGDNLITSYLKATSTTATSTNAFGFTMASSSVLVDGTTGRIAIGATTTPQARVANTNSVDPALSVLGLGSASRATGTVYIGNNSSTGGGQIILGSTDGQGCVSITATRGASVLDDDVTLVVKVVACPK